MWNLFYKKWCFLFIQFIEIDKIIFSLSGVKKVKYAWLLSIQLIVGEQVWPFWNGVLKTITG